MKRLLATLCCLFLTLSLYCQELSYSMPCGAGATAKREVRAVWLTTLGGLDWPKKLSHATQTTITAQQNELLAILDDLQATGINTVLLQCRIRGTAIYPASEPWDECLTGQPGQSPGYDPLAFAIAACHERGMELQAWVVCIPIGKWSSVGCVALRQRYPNMVKNIGGEGFLNPESPLTADYLSSLCADLATRYDLDGIHLDYIRYPETWPITVAKSRARDNITAIVRAISKKVRAVKPWVKISCAPVGKFRDLPRQSSKGWNAYDRVCQDVERWLTEGLVDELFPMMYFQGNQFFPFALDWQQRSHGRIIAPGLGVYFLSPQEQNWSLSVITQQLHVLRQYGMGYALFRTRHLIDNVKGLHTFIEHNFNTSPSLVPAMPWRHNTPPSAPTSLVVDSLAHTLSWTGAIDNSDGSYLTYNIYCSDTYPVDTDDARHLVLPRTMTTTIAVPLDGHYYAVTAMDRYGNESAACQMTPPTPVTLRRYYPLATYPTQLPCDSRYVTIPMRDILAKEQVAIYTLSGRLMRTVHPAPVIDIRMLPDGYYELRTIGKKGLSHRLGFFKKDAKGLSKQ